MEMDNRRASPGNFIASVVVFGMTAVIAIVLLLTVLVVWLSELMGSFIASALLVGSLSGILSIMIYLATIRDAVSRMRTQVETVYEVAQTAKMGYEWLTGKLLLFLKLRDEFGRQ